LRSAKYWFSMHSRSRPVKFEQSFPLIFLHLFFSFFFFWFSHLFLFSLLYFLFRFYIIYLCSFFIFTFRVPFLRDTWFFFWDRCTFRCFHIRRYLCLQWMFMVWNNYACRFKKVFTGLKECSRDEVQKMFTVLKKMFMVSK
jgi:hypothetical protein